jgi:parallel beta-helix repeat protein
MRTFEGKRVFIFAVILALLFSSFHPALVLADGETPVVETTEEPATGGKATEEIQVTEIIDESGENGEIGEQEPTEEGTEVPVGTTEVVEPGSSAVAETPTPESTTGDVETPPVEGTEAVEDGTAVQPTATATPDPQEEISDILVAAADADVNLADGNGDSVVMASQEGLELMEAVPDPWVIRAGVTHRFLSDCSGQPVDATNTCTVSTTPVQAAIDFADPGETVYLGAGTFQEDIEITKNLTLQGSSGTVIRSPDSINAEFSTSSGGKSPVIYVNNATVNIRNITVDGNGNQNNNAGFIGIGYHNAGGEVSDCLITNIIDTPFSGAQRGVGLYAYNEDGVSRTLSVFDNEFTNFQKNAMALSGNGLTVDVHDNDIVGAGATNVIAQNGIQVSYGATGEVYDNNITGINYPNNTWAASGILIYSAGGNVSVHGNTITNSDQAIYVQDSIAEVFDNTITDNYRALNNSSSTVNFYNNVVQNNTYGFYTPSTTQLQSTIANNQFIGNTYAIVLFGIGQNQINNNTISNSTYGFFSTFANSTLRENVFSGNAIGAEFDTNQQALGDAIYNYWGCDAGPNGTSANCNSAFGADFTPWLMDADGDFVFTSSDGTGGYVDNCPTVANPGQEDSDGDGIGDACESVPPGPAPAPVPVPVPAQPVDGVIPVTGGDVTRLVCPAGSNQVLFELENGNQVRFVGLCDLDAVVDTLGQTAMPHTLPGDTSYVSDLLIQVLDAGTLLDVLSGGSVEMSFVVPNDVDAANLALYYWDADTETWFEIDMYAADADYPMKLSDDSSNEQRMIYTGLSSVFSRATSSENFTGLFVLVSK